MKTALITGGSGFIGSHLCADLIGDGWQVEVLSRDAGRAQHELSSQVHAIESLDRARPAQAVVNLAGENLADGRWSQMRKREMLESRLRITRELAEVVSNWETPPEVLISGSAVGYYGARGEDVVDESQPPGDEFQSELCVAWEQASRRVESDGIRVCRIRTGLVLDAKAGALAQMLPPFRYGVGGHFGTGQQFMPWIHLNDEIRAIRFLIDREDCDGAFNLTAPNPVTNREFTATLAKVLHRPKLAWVPGPVLKLMLGEMAHLLLTGQRAIPDALQRAGFRFEFDELRGALEQLLAADMRRETA